jgi:aromatic ring-opening dioxygenase LigB subunit
MHPHEFLHLSRLLIIAGCCFSLEFADGALIGAMISPHGGAVLMPDQVVAENSESCTSNGCDEQAQAQCKSCASSLHAAESSAVKDLVALSPNLVVLTTPHSSAASFEGQVIYAGGSVLSGDSERGQVSARTSNESEALYKSLEAAGIPVQSAEVETLGWAELIPLWFLPEALRSNVIIIAVQGGSAKPCDLGKHLTAWLNSRADIRALWIVSGDMSHYHGSVHGCDGAPYDYSTTAATFESKVQCWASSLNHTDLDEAMQLDAGSCAGDGLIALDCGLSSVGSWDSCVRAHGVCTYFGMMVASFAPRGVSTATPSCLPCDRQDMANFTGFLTLKRRQAASFLSRRDAAGHAFVQQDVVRSKTFDEF